MKTLASLIFVISLMVVGTALSVAKDSRDNSSLLLPDRDIDTVKWYSASSESWEDNKGREKYKVNGVLVNKETYDKYTITSDQIYACHPCYVKTVTTNEKLLFEGDQVTDCPVGYWKEYYDNGSVKVEGHYKPDSTGVYDLKKSADWCAIRHGKWTYYNKNGSVDSVVNYMENVRVK